VCKEEVIFALLGSNGAGKTTAIKILAAKEAWARVLLDFLCHVGV